MLRCTRPLPQYIYIYITHAHHLLCLGPQRRNDRAEVLLVLGLGLRVGERAEERLPVCLDGLKWYITYMIRERSPYVWVWVDGCTSLILFPKYTYNSPHITHYTN